MARAGINDPKLADAVGSTRQQIHKLRHGDRKLTVQWAKRLAPHLDCTWQELIEGPAAPTDARRAGLLAIFDRMDERNRDTLFRIAQSLQENEPPSPPPSPERRTPPPRPMNGGRAARSPDKEDCGKNVALRRLRSVVGVEGR